MSGKKGFFVGFSHLLRIIRYHGGFFRFIDRLRMTDDAKIGHFIGQDSFGNRYYQNNYYFFPSNRWVIYSRKNFGLNYDASHIPAEWFNWIHHVTDIPPCQDPNRVRYPWMMEHTENLTGTSSEYVPYSTVKTKIHAWKPPSVPCPTHN